jgi:hypothetical protein
VGFAERAAIERAMAGPPGIQEVREQFLILFTCRDEKQQGELLERFRVERRSARR